MFNCHKNLISYHDEKVSLPKEMKDGMRKRRNANQDRLHAGLKKAKKALPLRHVKQGSYSMHTMVQAEYATSDIDDGAIFAKADLVGPQGGEYTPLQSKTMVKDALQDKSFNKQPNVKINCVRVYYNDGFTVDIPVYREVEKDGVIAYELASSSWKNADPEGVTQWFNENVKEKSPDSTNGKQMRRLVKLLKAWGKSRKWNMPSGFIFSVLTNENYNGGSSYLKRDDKAFLRLLEDIEERLQDDLVVKHPVVSCENITKSDDDSNMRQLRERLPEAIETLSVLRKDDCTTLDALKALKKVFNTDYFDDEIKELEKDVTKSALGGVAGIGFTKTGENPGKAVKKDKADKRYA